MTQLTVPSVAGHDLPSLIRWARQLATTVNDLLRRNSFAGAFFVWDDGCVSVPTSTTIANAEEIVFESPFSSGIAGDLLTEGGEDLTEENGSSLITESSVESYATLIVTGIGFEGGVHVALNGRDFGTLSSEDTANEVLYEVQVDNLVKGLNVFQIWSESSDSGELRRLEVWRNFTRESIIDSGETAIWGSVTGDGKPEDNADVTSDHADDIIFRQASLPSDPQEGWIWQDTDDLRVYRRTSGAWVQIGADDALLLGLNAPAESGADETQGHAEDIIFRQATEPSNPQEGWVWQDTDDRRVYRYTSGAWVQISSDDALLLGLNAPADASADQTINNLELKGDADDNPAVGRLLGSTVSTTNGGGGTEWQDLRSFVTNFTGTFRLMVEAKETVTGADSADGGWRLKNGSGNVVHTETISSSTFTETFSDEETVSEAGEIWTIEGLSQSDLSTFTVETELRDIEVRSRFDHATIT